MKKLAFLLFAIVAGTLTAVVVKANKAKSVAYCHCEPDRTCTSAGTKGIKVSICP